MVSESDDLRDGASIDRVHHDLPNRRRQVFENQLVLAILTGNVLQGAPGGLGKSPGEKVTEYCRRPCYQQHASEADVLLELGHQEHSDEGTELADARSESASRRAHADRD